MDAIVKLVGVLGFLLSVFVFVLTRWERRKHVVIELFRGDLARIDPDGFTESQEPSEIIAIRVTNLGPKPIAVHRNSFTICGNDRTISVFETNWAGLDRIPAPLAPNSSFEVGVFTDVFEEMLGVKDFPDVMNPENFHKSVINVRAAFKDIEGKTFSTKNKYQYNFSVSDF